MGKKANTRAPLWLRLRNAVVAAAGLGSAAALVWLGFPLLGLLPLAVVAVVAAVLFSSRDEPSQRLLELIRAFWRDR